MSLQDSIHRFVEKHDFHILEKSSKKTFKLLLAVWLVTLGLIFYAVYQERKMDKQLSDFNLLYQRFEQSSAHQAEEYKKQQAKILILEEAINPKDRRWANIQAVRKVILETIRDSRYPQYMTPLEITTAASTVVDASEQYDVPKSLILAVMRKESAFNPKAVSKANAQGLMQLLPSTAEECAKDLNIPYYNTFFIKDNIRLGTWYISKMLRRFGNFDLAVRAYNAGPQYVEKVKSNDAPVYPEETVDYVKYVLEWQREYEKLGL